MYETLVWLDAYQEEPWTLDMAAEITGLTQDEVLGCAFQVVEVEYDYYDAEKHTGHMER